MATALLMRLTILFPGDEIRFEHSNGNQISATDVTKFLPLFSEQDQRRLGAIIVPNNDEVLAEAKRKSILGENGELAKDKVMNMLYDELKTW